MLKLEEWVSCGLKLCVMWLPYVGPEAWRHNADFIVSLSGKHRAVLTPVGKQEFGSSPAELRFLQRQKASRSAAASMYLSCQLFHWPNQALLNLSFPTRCCCIYNPLVQLLQHQTKGLAAVVKYWLTEPPHMPHEEYTITLLPVVSQGIGRGENNLPAPAACFPLSCSLSDAAETCSLPWTLSAYLPSLIAHSATALIPLLKK